MKRIRNLGIAAVAVLALAASVGVASAAAAGFQAGTYPAEISAEAIETPVFGIGLNTIVCAGATGGGGTVTGEGGKFETAVPISTATPCTLTRAGVKENYTLETNGCKFGFKSFQNGFDLGSTGCGPMVLNGVNCDYSFNSQTNIPIWYTNATEAGVAIVQMKTKTGTGLAYSRTGNESYCGPATGTAYLQGSWKLVAKNGGGKVSLSVSGNGLRAGVTTFASEWSPVTVSGGLSSTSKLTLGPNGTKCTSAPSIPLGTVMASPVTSLPLEGEYSECSVFKLGVLFPAEIKVNSCHYALNAGGTFDIACSKAGDAVEVIVRDTSKEAAQICLYKLGPQTGVAGLTYTNEGSGASGSVAVGLELKTLSFTVAAAKTEALCGKSGANGAYSGAATLLGPPFS